MKILILTQNIKNKEVMQQGLAMAKAYASTIGINLEYSFKETTKAFTTITYNTYTMVNPQEILDEADTSNKIVCLLHNISGVTNPFQQPLLKNGCNPIQIPENWWVTFPDVLCAYFLHEVCHSGYYFANNVAGDITHNQQSFPEWQSKQAYEYYLHLLKELKPFLETTTMTSNPTVTITRSKSTKKQTLGKLVAKVGNATFTCNTLELPWLNNASNISCIPTGTYQVKWTLSPRFMRYTYEVLKVPGRAGIRFHWGNYFYNYQGCIGLGASLSDINKDGELDIVSTKNTVRAFEGFMGHKTFTLIIK